MVEWPRKLKYCTVAGYLKPENLFVGFPVLTKLPVMASIGVPIIRQLRYPAIDSQISLISTLGREYRHECCVSENRYVYAAYDLASDNSSRQSRRSRTSSLFTMARFLVSETEEDDLFSRVLR